MTIEKKLLGTNPVSGVILPEGVGFDSDDNINRSSDLTSNTDSKTFTFSCWLYSNGSQMTPYFSLPSSGSAGSFNITMQGGGALTITSRISGSTSNNLYLYSPSVLMPIKTWSHVLASIDMANLSGSKLYINDQAATFSTYPFTNTPLNFTNAVHKIGHQTTGRISNLFLDYTYRDLTVTANRRLFITADGKPSDTIPSNPIIYLPLKDAATAGSNSGTGGNFTGTYGLPSTASRGPNQDNCSASKFDGSNDYLSRSSISGLSDSKLVTFSFNASQTSGSAQIFTVSNGRFSVKIESKRLYVLATNAAGGVILNLQVYPNKVRRGQNNSFSFSFDLSDTSKRHMFINGVDVTSEVTFSAYLNQVMDLTLTPYAIGAAADGSSKFNGSIGEFYLDTAYIDLATENPFWDSDANRPNSLRKVIEDTGVTPAIAMPLIGNNAGNNLGSGGDFTVNSGPYTGARGASEYRDRSWARSETNASGSNVGYMYRDGTGFGLTAYNNNTATLVTTFLFHDLPTGGLGGNGDVSSNQQNIIRIGRSTDYAENMYLYYNKNYNSFRFGSRSGQNSRDVIQFERNNEATLSTGVWYTIMISYNSSNANTAWMYINRSGTNVMTDIMGTPTVTSDTTNWQATDDIIIGGSLIGTHMAPPTSMEMSMLYMDTSYIDFSQEANREKFSDALGYPRDLTQQIEDGDVTNPLIYMKFDDSSNFGLNSGRGSNFTIQSTLLHGSDYVR